MKQGMTVTFSSKIPVILVDNKICLIFENEIWEFKDTFLIFKPKGWNEVNNTVIIVLKKVKYSLVIGNPRPLVPWFERKSIGLVKGWMNGSRKVEWEIRT